MTHPRTSPPASRVTTFLGHGCLVLLCYAGVLVWVYGRAVAGDGLLSESDLYEYFLPIFLSSPIDWSTSEFAGIPVFADPAEAWPYPLFWLFSRVIGSWAGYAVSAHVVTACGSYLYVRTVTGSRASAFFAGIAFALSEAMLERLAQMATLHVIAWMPWVFFAIEKVCATGSRRWAALGSGVIACLMLAGHPQPAIYICTAALAYVLVAGRATRASGRFYRLALFMFAVAGALAAIKLVPFAQATRHMARDTISFGHFLARGNEGPQLWSALFPTVLHDGREAPTYIGLVPLLCALVGATQWRREWRVGFWVAATVIAAMFGIGHHSPIAAFAYDYLPGYSRFRIAARHLIIASFGGVVLASIGLDAIMRGRARVRVWFATAGFVAAIVAGVIYLSRPRPGLEFEGRAPIAWSAVGLSAALSDDLWTQVVLATFAVLGVAALARLERKRLWIGLLAMFTVVDLLNAQPFQLTPRGVAQVMMPHSAAQPSVHARAIRDDLEPLHQRFLAFGGTNRDPLVPAAWARIWNIPIAGGYGPMLLDRHSRLSTMGRNGAVQTRVLAPGDQSLNLLAVRIVAVLPEDVASFGSIHAGGVSWDRQPLDFAIGRDDCGHAYPRSTTVTLPADMTIKEVRAVLYLRCGEAVPQGAAVGTLGVISPDGRRQTRTLVAGVDVSEAALADPDVLARAAHRPVRGFDDPAANGRLHSLITMPLSEPVSGGHLEITAEGFGGWLTLGRLTVVDDAGRMHPQAAGELFLRDTRRWREVRRLRTTYFSDRDVDRDADRERELVLYENLEAMPRAWLVPRVETIPVDEIGAAIRTGQLPGGQPFHPARTALVAAEDGGPPTAAFSTLSASVAVEHVRNGGLALRVSSDGGGFLVVSETHYPGWNATIDGVATPVYRANLSLQGVVVPSGPHLVEFTFVPVARYAGAGVSLVGLCAAVWLLVRPQPRQ